MVKEWVVDIARAQETLNGWVSKVGYTVVGFSKHAIKIHEGEYD